MEILGVNRKGSGGERQKEDEMESAHEGGTDGVMGILRGSVEKGLGVNGPSVLDRGRRSGQDCPLFSTQLNPNTDNPDP